MAYLATITSGNFSQTYNIIDYQSASLYHTGLNGYNLFNNIASRLWFPTAVGTVLSTTSAGFNFGTTGSITHIGLKVNRWLQTATISIKISDITNSMDVAGTTITFSTAGSYNLYPVDVAGSTYYSQHYSWEFFKFVNPVTFSTTATYAVSLKASNVSGAVAYICSSSNYDSNIFTVSSSQYALSNIMKAFITSATQTATSNDQIFIQGEIVNQAGVWSQNTYNSCTISMLGTSSATASNGIEISYGGSLVFGTASNTDYYLKLSGDLVVNSGGYFSIGSLANRFATSSTATLAFGASISVGSGIFVNSYGVIEIIGATVTPWTYLSNTSATGSISITTSIATGWKSGDSILLTPTGFSYSEYDLATISSISGTNITATTPLTYLHSGDSPYIGEIANLSRNIKIIGDPTNNMYIEMRGGQANIQYVEFKNIGANSNPGSGPVLSSNGNWINPYGIGLNTEFSSGLETNTICAINPGSTGLTYSKSRSFIGCSFNKINNYFNNKLTALRSTSGYGAYTAHQLNNILMDNNVIFNVPLASPVQLFEPGFTNNSWPVYQPYSYTSNSGTFSNSLFVYCSNSSDFFLSNFAFINNNFAGLYGSPYFGFNINTSNYIIGDINNLIFHSCYSSGVDGVNFRGKQFKNGKTFKNINIWNNNVGLSITSYDSVFENLNIYNTGKSATSSSTGNTLIINKTFNIKIINSTISNTALSPIFYSYETMLSASPADYSHIIFDNVNFINNSTYSLIPFDSFLLSGGTSQYLNYFCNWNFNNCKTNNLNLISGANRLTLDSAIKFNYLNGLTYSSYYKNGYTYRDSNYYLSASYSTAIVPQVITYSLFPTTKFAGMYKYIPAAIGKRTIISVWVRKSSTGDSATYNGAEIRLILAQNSSLNITSDTVLTTTTSASNGAWEKITGTTITAVNNDTWEVYLDCDGNTGFINVTDWSLSYIQ